MKIYYLLIVILFFGCKQTKVSRAENLKGSTEHENRCIANPGQLPIDSIRVTTELNSQSYELLIGKNGDYWLISSNEIFHDRSRSPLNGQSYRGTLRSQKHKDLFELVNRKDFDENCRFSNFYKDSVRVCKTFAKITHTAINLLQLYHSNCLQKEFKFYTKDTSESWILTKQAYTLISVLITEIELQSKKSKQLPAYDFKRQDIKMISLRYAVGGEYFGLHQSVSSHEISINEYYKLLEMFSGLKSINPFLKSNIEKGRFLKEIFIITVKYNDNRSESIWIGPKYLRIKNRPWRLLDRDTRKMVRDFAET